jgi:hypothetical protein
MAPSGLRRSGLLVAICVACVGCEQADQIHSYTVPAEKAPASAAVSVATGEPTDRMLAAIVPHGQRAWFFKAVGPIGVIDQEAQQIVDFLSTVRVAGDQQPTWKLPAGWQEQAGSGMRAATITIPGKDKPLELTVVALPWSGGPTDVLSNVNRWRGQLQLPPIGQPGLALCTRELSLDGTSITLVDLAGRMQATGMSAPFAGAPFAGGAPAAAAPAGAMPDNPHAAAQPAAPGTPHFDVPDAWQELPAAPPRRAAFRVTDGSQEALVTVIDFPAAAGPMIADPLPNLNRWRREVGLPEVAATDVDKDVATITIAGQPAKYFQVLPGDQPDQARIERATLAVMFPRGAQIWFIKMTGDVALITAQREQFRSFVGSLRFADDAGGNDGNQ